MRQAVNVSCHVEQKQIGSGELHASDNIYIDRQIERSG